MSNAEFAMSDKVLEEPEIVLFVSTVVDVPVTTVASTARVISLPEPVEVIPVPPRIPKVSPLTLIVPNVEVSSFTLKLAPNVVPSPIDRYISSKFRLTLSAPARRLSPVPSFAVVPLFIAVSYTHLTLPTKA